MRSLSFIIELTRRDFTERFAGSALGALWAFIWPLFHLFIYIVIFGRIMGARLPGSGDVYAYGVYLASGLIAWSAFSQTVTRATAIFHEKKPIISKVRLSLPSLILFVASAESVTYLISMTLFFIFLIVTDFPLSHHLALLPCVYLLQVAFALGLGLMAATLSVFIRDLKELVGITMQLWFWFTPIVYVPEILPETVRGLMKWNPAYLLIDAYHRILVFRELPDMAALGIMTLGTLLLLYCSFGVFRKLEKDVRDFL